MEQEETLKNLEKSVMRLRKNIAQLNQTKANVSSEVKLLEKKIDKCSPDSDLQSLESTLQTLKDLERQETDLESDHFMKHSKLQDEVNELENMLQYAEDEKRLLENSERFLSESNEKLNLAKMELAAKLRAIFFLKRQLDDVPLQGELIQYERRLSELYAHIQRKLEQTRKYYATFNALSEIKDLMLKETSLLNSISSQFQDAISSTAGRTKLTGLIEEISQGSQQKLERVQLALQAEQKVYNSLKEKYAAAISEQRCFYSLLKAFQEECARNERLRSQTTQLYS